MTLKSITTTLLVGMFDLGKLECTAGLTCNCYKFRDSMMRDTA
jgi:hypothetical protein